LADNLHPIIIKRKALHAGHHGGAWKVAYADFVTAMMALFIVLWLLSASKEVQVTVGGYFRDPRGSSKNVGNNKEGADFVPMKKQDMQKLKDQIVQSIHHIDPQDKLKNHIEITVTAEGLRIELMESAKGTFFEIGSVQPTGALRELLQVLSQELGQLPNKISIEGHTDSTPYSQVNAYDNWDLSPDAGSWDSKRPDIPGARVCRSASASAGPAERSVQSQNFADCPISGERWRGDSSSKSFNRIEVMRTGK